VRDWPAMKYRGISDDLSRGPVPKLEFQEHVVRTLAAYKMNVYSPYMEVAFAYTNEPLSAPPGGAMTPDDLRQLVAYAAKYHVTVIPEQEAFGHLHHALMFEKYDALGETPLGSALAPGQPVSAELIRSWFKELAALTPGPFLHIGADEVNELGLGQSKPLIESKGAAKTYIDFVTQIHAELEPLHKRLLFWGDIAMKDPELVKRLPKDMIAIAWEYGPRADGFDKWIRPFTDAGMETWVSPGINDWGRIYPSNYEGLPNIQEFVRDGQRLGATGMLNTVWNAEEDDEGLFNNDWYGVLFGAAASWQPGESDIARYEADYGPVFHGDESGKINAAESEITAAEEEFRAAGYPHGADTPLFWADPWTEQGQVASAKLLPHAREIRLHAERAIELVEQAEQAAPLRETDTLSALKLGARRIDFFAFKLEAADQIAQAYRLAVERNDGRRSVGSPLFHVDYLYEDLIYTFGELHDLYQREWNKQNRPYALHNVMVRYDLNEQEWMRRRDEFDDAKAHFAAKHSLPPASTLEIPASDAH
jgi:hexosaminidase